MIRRHSIATILLTGLLPLSAHAAGPKAAPAPRPATEPATEPAPQTPPSAPPADRAPEAADADALPPVAQAVPQTPAVPAPPPAVAIPEEEQPRTLMSGHTARGGYGALRIAFTRVQGRAGAMVGGRGAFLANHRFAIGLAGQGLVSRVDSQRKGLDTDRGSGLAMGYGGLWLETILLPMHVVHVSAGALLGAGGVGYGRWSRGMEEEGWNRGSAIFVAEPSLALELNVAAFLRFAIEGSYRFVAGSDLAGITDKELSGWTVGTVLKFGKF